MRTLLTALLATALIPAAAVAQDRDGGARFQREAQDGTARPAPPRRERPDRAERQRRDRSGVSADASVSIERQRGGGERWRGDERRDRAVAAPQPGIERGRDRPRGWAPVFQGNSDGRRGDWARRDDATDRDRGDWRGERDRREGSRDRDRDRDRDRERNGRWNEGRSWNGDRDRWDRDDRRRWDGRGWDRDDRRWDGRDRDFRRWDRGWRNNNRYDWQRYRSSNRYAFRLPRYAAPYGWQYGYRRQAIGATLFGGLFAQDYWIGDPWAYRLPPAEWPYQWVRYYNDALLVDTRTGYVADVIPEIFWY